MWLFQNSDPQVRNQFNQIFQNNINKAIQLINFIYIKYEALQENSVKKFYVSSNICLLDKIVQFCDAKQLECATLVLQRVITLNSQYGLISTCSSFVYFGMAYLQFSRGNLKKSIFLYTKCTKFAKGFYAFGIQSAAFNNISCIYQKLNNLNKATFFAKKALSAIKQLQLQLKMKFSSNKGIKDEKLLKQNYDRLLKETISQKKKKSMSESKLQVKIRTISESKPNLVKSPSRNLSQHSMIKQIQQIVKKKKMVKDLRQNKALHLHELAKPIKLKTLHKQKLVRKIQQKLNQQIQLNIKCIRLRLKINKVQRQQVIKSIEEVLISFLAIKKFQRLKYCLQIFGNHKKMRQFQKYLMKKIIYNRKKKYRKSHCMIFIKSNRKILYFVRKITDDCYQLLVDKLTDKYQLLKLRLDNYDINQFQPQKFDLNFYLNFQRNQIDLFSNWLQKNKEFCYRYVNRMKRFSFLKSQSKKVKEQYQIYRIFIIQYKYSSKDDLLSDKAWTPFEKQITILVRILSHKTQGIIQLQQLSLEKISKKSRFRFVKSMTRNKIDQISDREEFTKRYSISLSRKAIYKKIEYSEFVRQIVLIQKIIRQKLSIERSKKIKLKYQYFLILTNIKNSRFYIFQIKKLTQGLYASVSLTIYEMSQTASFTKLSQFRRNLFTQMNLFKALFKINPFDIILDDSKLDFNMLEDTVEEIIYGSSFKSNIMDGMLTKHSRLKMIINTLIFRYSFIKSVKSLKVFNKFICMLNLRDICLFSMWKLKDVFLICIQSLQSKSNRSFLPIYCEVNETVRDILIAECKKDPLKLFEINLEQRIFKLKQNWQFSFKRQKKKVNKSYFKTIELTKQEHLIQRLNIFNKRYPEDDQTPQYIISINYEKYQNQQDIIRRKFFLRIQIVDQENGNKMLVQDQLPLSVGFNIYDGVYQNPIKLVRKNSRYEVIHLYKQQAKQKLKNRKTINVKGKSFFQVQKKMRSLKMFI